MKKILLALLLLSEVSFGQTTIQIGGASTTSVVAGSNITLNQAGNTYTVGSTGGTPSGAAGGDLTGTYPNPTINGQTGNSGNVLTTNGTNVSWTAFPSSGYLNYYFSNTASDVATYYKQLPTPAATATISASGVTNGQVLGNFITDPNSPGRSYLPSGLYQVNVHAAQTSGTKTSTIYAEIWETNSSGVDIAKIATTGSSIALTGINADLFITISVANSYTFASASSRIDTRIYATISGGGSAPTIALYVGDTSDSRTIIPSPTVDATIFVPYTGATANVNLGTNTLTSPAIYGSASSGGNLQLQSTSNSTKGIVLVDTNAMSNKWWIGSITPSMYIRQSGNDEHGIIIDNPTHDTKAAACLLVGQDSFHYGGIQYFNPQWNNPNTDYANDVWFTGGGSTKYTVLYSDGYGVKLSARNNTGNLHTDVNFPALFIPSFRGTGGSSKANYVCIGDSVPNYPLDVNGDINTRGIYRVNGSQIASTNLSDITTGTFVPTYSLTANVAAVTTYNCQYVKTANMVTVSGNLMIDVTSANTTSQIIMTVPINSTFSTGFEAGGTGMCIGDVCGFGVSASNFANKVEFDWKCGANTANLFYSFSYTYRID